jgi:hypothetical protein
MGRIITLSIAVLVMVGGAGVVLSEAVKQDDSEPVKQDSGQVDQTPDYRDNSSGKPIFAPPGYARPMGGVPNPDAPARSQLDPGLHHVGPAGVGEPILAAPRYARPMGGIPNPDAPARSQLDPGLRYIGP